MTDNSRQPPSHHQSVDRQTARNYTDRGQHSPGDLSKIQEELEVEPLAQQQQQQQQQYQADISISSRHISVVSQASSYSERIRQKVSSMVNPKKKRHLHQEAALSGQPEMPHSDSDRHNETVNVHTNILHDHNDYHESTLLPLNNIHNKRNVVTDNVAAVDCSGNASSSSGTNYNAMMRTHYSTVDAVPASTMASTSIINFSDKQLNQDISGNERGTTTLNNNNNSRHNNNNNNNIFSHPNATGNLKVVACPDGHSFKQVVVTSPTKFNTTVAANATNSNNNNNTNTNTTTTTTTTTGNIRSPDGSSSLNSSALNSCAMSKSSSEIRLRWGKKMDFLLSIIGFAVDLANIWRFPYLCYKNGGGVFLIPYIIMLIFGGIPLFFLELLLGQFVKKGPITVWNKICPSMKGVGYCSILISWYVSFYYNILIAWSVYFIYRSVISTTKMPWEECNHEWNNATTCMSIRQMRDYCAPKLMTIEECKAELLVKHKITSPAQEFFVKELLELDKSTGLEDMGYLRPGLVACTFVVYVLHFFSLFRGLETSGKVVWVTATAPYLILTILLIRGLFLPGAAMGIAYYLSPKLEKLGDPSVWVDAAGQVFYSIGVGFGVHLTYASFNGHNNNCYRDCLVTSAVNAATSIYSGLVVFVYLGYMATNLGIEINKVAEEGYSLVFEVYPEALTTLPFAKFWSILFFIMLLTLGIDSAMGGLEAVITGLEDEFKIARKLTRGQLTFIVIASSFFPALISCTQGGAYTMYWFDIYAAGVSLLLSALFEAIGVVYCYGLKKFIPNIESMLGKKPHMFYIICWKYISPFLLGVVIVMGIFSAERPKYRDYKFPNWSIVAGWIFAFSSVSAIPIVAIATWFKNRQTRDSLRAIQESKKRRQTNDTMFSTTTPAESIKSKSKQYAQSMFGSIFIGPYIVNAS